MNPSGVHPVEDYKVVCVLISGHSSQECLSDIGALRFLVVRCINV